MMHPEPTMKRAGDPTGAMDRLSALPDGLLHAIMSFLPAPQVVQTSLLSQRWRGLWRSTPRIEIDEQDFGMSAGISCSTLEGSWARFEDFATNLLLFHDNTSSLGEFRLRSRVYNCCHVDRWIRRGFEYCPAVVQIQIVNCDIAFRLPPVAASSFRRLKRLRLWNVILDSHFTSVLCSACPVLEDLDLQFSGISLCKMDSLVRADIFINETLSQKTQCELLGSLFNVTSLELTGFESEVMLNDNSDEFPIFRNMRTLDLHSCFLDDYELNDKLEALGNFLQNAPCLEKLILQDCMFYSFADSEWDIARKNITLRCQDRRIFRCQTLKLIEVLYYHDHDHQLIELVWSLGRSLPDASIKLKKTESPFS